MIRTKELYEPVEQEEIPCPPIHHCTSCNMTWHALKLDQHGDESYEVCPLCKSDMFLEDTWTGPAYVMDQDGVIRNFSTGEKYQAATPPAPPDYVLTGHDKAMIKVEIENALANKNRAEKERLEDERIEKHIKETNNRAGGGDGWVDL